MSELEFSQSIEISNPVSLQHPIAEQLRLVNLDIIRGVALLGILIMNIQSFSMIITAYSNPLSFGDFSGSNQTIYYFSHLFADQKFMSIFAALFGAGIILMTSGLEEKGVDAKRLHYRRMSILAGFGLIHLYLLWYGDILFVYAVMGIIVFSLRHKSPRFLLIGGFIAVLITAAIMYLLSVAMPYMSESDLQELMTDWMPTQDAMNAEIRANQSNWLGQMAHRHTMANEMLLNSLFYCLRVLGLMMAGMALFKIGFFSNRFSNRSLLLQGLACFAFGSILIITRLESNIANGFPIENMLPQENYWGSLLLGYSYLCFLVVFCRLNIFAKTKRALANVGRMALTNYLSQTLICTFIFYGWGLGKFGTFDRTEQLLLVLAIWIIQITFSTLWLNRFKFGPFEWLWRSMTYGTRQPFKRP
ncbi:DUF418 domain-containing protein [Gammaproteobacteria bacterium]|nr:DUF418 domain-containing protein [Gammaproteobacteria bacterium]